jgi:multidrug efflux pump subunit AcrA (membrane-fusion protein)
VLPASTSGAAAGSSPTYPAVVLVPAAVPALASGARADVTLVVSTARNVLTVPSSAVTRLANGSGVVTEAQGGSTRRTVVTTGAVSGTSVQVLTGLSLGQRVVLADLAAPLPTGSAATTRRFGGGAGFDGGADFGGGAGQPRG